MNNNVETNHWDIFCTVIDNYGDIGVTWRLARQLANEFQITVVLWVDDLNSFSHILPNLDKSLNSQQCHGVIIKRWQEPFVTPWQMGQVIIEAFACELPLPIIHKMQQNKLSAPIWLNLEYLTAEDWVESCHGLPSIDISGLKKYFYFPGFSHKTGGLICENSLFKERDLWQSNSNNRMHYFEELGLKNIDVNDTFISVFSYESAALTTLCKHWQNSVTPIHILVPNGRSLISVLSSFTLNIEDNIAQHYQAGNLTVHVLPMTDQIGYDQLLWSCDFNIVRGEDSFLRAQWAAKPFIWHIYAQKDDAHLTKLEAFISVYCDNLAPNVAETWSKLNLAFNTDNASQVIEQWQQLNFVTLPLLQHAKQWPNDALNNADLATRLIQFIKSCK